MSLYLVVIMYTLILVHGESVKRVRHYQGCANSSHCNIYWSYVHVPK